MLVHYRFNIFKVFLTLAIYMIYAALPCLASIFRCHSVGYYEFRERLCRHLQATLLTMLTMLTGLLPLPLYHVYTCML